MRLGLRAALPFALPTAAATWDFAVDVVRWTGIAAAAVVTAGAIVVVSAIAVMQNLS